MSSVCTTIHEQASEKGPRGASRQGSLRVGTEPVPLGHGAGTQRPPLSPDDTPSSIPSSTSFMTAGSLPILAESSQVCTSCWAEHSRCAPHPQPCEAPPACLV